MEYIGFTEKTTHFGIAITTADGFSSLPIVPSSFGFP